MDPRDRIVDHALRRLHRGERAEPDLAATVRAAWERGATGPDLSDLEDAQPWPAEPVPRRRRRVRPYALAAAAVLLVALGAGWLLSTPPEPAPRVELSRALPVLDQGRWVVADGRTRPLGEPIWVDGFAPVTLDLPGGGSLAVQPGSRLTVEERRVRLDWGALQASAGAEGLVLEAGASRVELDPGAVVGLELAWDHRRPDPEQLHLVEPAAYARRQGVGRLRVERLTGGARLVAGGDPSPALPVGQALALALDASGPHPLAPGTLADLETLFEEALRFEGYDPGNWTDPADTPLVQLLARLAGEPAAWVDLGPRVAARLAGKLEPLERRHALDLLVLDGGRSAQRLVEAQWAAHPAAFTVEHRVAMAERDHPLFQREVEAIVVLNDPADRDAPHVDPASWIDPLLPAAYLALRGNDLGVPALKTAAGAFTTLAGERSALIAALALKAGGFDDRPWEECARALEREAREALARGSRDEAAVAALVWEMCVLALEGEPPLRLAYFEDRAMGHVGARFFDLPDEDSLRALIEELATR